MRGDNTFREYLSDMFAEQYCNDGGLDDEMPDAEADWFADLDPEEVIDWAEVWGKKLVKQVDEYEKLYKEIGLKLEREKDVY